MVWKQIKKFLKYALSNQDGFFKIKIGKYSVDARSGRKVFDYDSGADNPDLNVRPPTGGTNPNYNSKEEQEFIESGGTSRNIKMGKKSAPTPKKVGKINYQLMDPNYKGGVPYDKFQKFQSMAEGTQKGIGEGAAEVSQQFRDLKFRHGAMRDADGNLVQSESFGIGKQQAEAKRDKDIAAAEAAGKGATSRAMATQSMFGSSGGGARSRSEAQQAGITQAGQQGTRSATASQIGQMAAEDLQQQGLREQGLEDQMMLAADDQQKAFGLEYEGQRAVADSNRPDMDWERSIAAQNVTTMNQATLADKGYTTQLTAARAQSGANFFGGLVNAGAVAYGGGQRGGNVS